MQRPNLQDWILWIAFSVPVCAYLVPAVFGESGSVAFVALMWWIVRLESTARGFATQDRVIAFILFEKRSELAKTPLEAFLETPYHRIGCFVFPKRLSNCWTISAFIGVVGGCSPVASAYFESGAFKPEAYSFGMLAEIWTMVAVQMAFWVRHNLTHRNWKTPRQLFDALCNGAQVDCETKSKAWEKCREADLVTES